MHKLPLFDQGFASRISAAFEDFLNIAFELNWKTKKINPDDLVWELSLEEDFYYLGILSKLEGGVTAYALILMDLSSADELINTLTNEHICLLDEYKETAMQELANIVIGAFSSEVEKKTGERVDYQIPLVAVDLPMALADAICSKISETNDQEVLLLDLKCPMPLIYIKILFFYILGCEKLA